MQNVQDRWQGFFGIWYKYLVEELDMVVVSVDNRGSSGRGKEFASALYKNMGTVEAQDQIAAAKHFGVLSVH